MLRSVAALAGMMAAHLAFAQATALPAPSRTVYKCTVGGKVVYSDDPCVDAKRIDVVPTRGMNKATGRERIGADVSRERQEEQVARALNPLSDMTSEQFETRRRRFDLSAQAKAECRALDASLMQLEAEEGGVSGQARAAVQRQLFAARKRYRELRC